MCVARCGLLVCWLFFWCSLWCVFACFVRCSCVVCCLLVGDSCLVLIGGLLRVVS